MKTLSIFILIFVFNSVFCQENSPLKFDVTTHNFGLVKEEDEQVSYHFIYKNISDSIIRITQVTTSCGCTASEWKKEPILPKENGVIKVTYKTTKRPGKFTQPILVHINNDSLEQINLFITGEVLPKQKTMSEIYPIPIGNLRFKSTHVTFNKIKNDTIAVDTLKYYNNWDKPMTISLENTPSFITYKAVPDTLKAFQEGYLLMAYDASKRMDIGLIYDRLVLKTNDSIDILKGFHISAEIEENFSKYNLNDLKLAPEMTFKTESFDFDTITEGTVVSYEFNFTNTGVNDLHVRKISTSCGCTISKTSSEIIKGGQEGSITVDFNSTNKKGYQRQTITIITNNPHRPTIKLVMQGYVKAKD